MTLKPTPTQAKYFPIAAACLLEYANIGQLVRMWGEHTAAGQSLPAWISVGAALLFYTAFYWVCTPEQRWARLATAVSSFTNIAVIATVLRFRYFA